MAVVGPCFIIHPLTSLSPSVQNFNSCLGIIFISRNFPAYSQLISGTGIESGRIEVATLRVTYNFFLRVCVVAQLGKSAFAQFFPTANPRFGTFVHFAACAFKIGFGVHQTRVLDGVLIIFIGVDFALPWFGSSILKLSTTADQQHKRYAAHEGINQIFHTFNFHFVIQSVSRESRCYCLPLSFFIKSFSSCSDSKVFIQST